MVWYGSRLRLPQRFETIVPFSAEKDPLLHPLLVSLRNVSVRERKGSLCRSYPPPTRLTDTQHSAQSLAYIT